MKVVTAVIAVIYVVACIDYSIIARLYRNIYWYHCQILIHIALFGAISFHSIPYTTLQFSTPTLLPQIYFPFIITTLV
jgi:hypothetical protein